MSSATTISHSLPPTNNTMFMEILPTIIVPKFMKQIEQHEIPNFINMRNIFRLPVAHRWLQKFVISVYYPMIVLLPLIKNIACLTPDSQIGDTSKLQIKP